MLFLSAVMFAAAQEGGIKGKVVSRVGRNPIEGAKVTLSVMPERVVYTQADGAFLFEGVPYGTYRMRVDAVEFQTTEIFVKVDVPMKDINYVTMAAEFVSFEVDDAYFVEFDTESGGDAQAMPVTLSASKDVFENIAGYKFSSLRYRNRGYETGMQEVYLNGIQMNDVLTGYSTWSLWSGLNDAVRNQESTTGNDISNFGVGGINGTVNIDARASALRTGFRSSVVHANAQYALRLMASYASGMNDKGWAYAFSASARLGRNYYVDGIFYNAYAYYASVEKQFNPLHRLSFTFLGVPTQRGAQMAATEEVYEMVGSHFYNPNWGYQDGEIRNARVRNYHEPLAILNYNFTPNDKTSLSVVASYRFGKNGYSSLDWYDARDPKPDYHKNLPSYFEFRGEYDKATNLWYDWRNDLGGIQQIRWDKLYDTNRNNWMPSTDESGNVISGTEGLHRSKYILSERHTDQRDLHLKVQLARVVNRFSNLNAGLNLRYNRSEYYNMVKDLLGGDYWLNVDNFAERDFKAMSRNDISRGNENLVVGEGDKYGYDYYAHVREAKIWATYAVNISRFEGYAALEGGYSDLWREGLYRKELFADNSYGKSERPDFFTYTAKLGATYKISGSHNISVGLVAQQNAPYFQDAFISPRTRSDLVPELTTEKVWSGDLSYMYNSPWLRMRLTGYYSVIKDQTKLISFYDDLQSTFTNFAMDGIDQRHMGIEFGFQHTMSYLLSGLRLSGAVSVGDYEYTSNPDFIQTQDNSANIVNRDVVLWKGYKVESTPQIAANIGLNWRSPHYWYLGIDLSYYDKMYLSMNPLYRSQNLHDILDNEEKWQEMKAEERFDPAFVLNANVGKSWYINRKYQFGFSLEVKNILNNKNIRTGGFEQMRVRSDRKEGEYNRFDSKYFYLFPINYYLNIYLRF